MICEKCKNEYQGKFGSGRFCSKACANSRIPNENTKAKQSKSMKDFYVKNPVVKKPDYKKEMLCEKCGDLFLWKADKRRKIHCDKCKRKCVKFKEGILSITGVSKRTISKILNRANKCCSICGWNEAICDIHHIIPKHKGGSEDHSNLIIVCPNCHRVSHKTKKYSIEFLQNLSIENTFADWKDFYNLDNQGEKK